MPLLFLQFQQMLMHRAQKRMQNSLSLNEISPHLAAISSSCITMPGHNQGDEVCILLLYLHNILPFNVYIHSVLVYVYFYVMQVSIYPRIIVIVQFETAHYSEIYNSIGLCSSYASFLFHSQ